MTLNSQPAPGGLHVATGISSTMRAWAGSDSTPPELSPILNENGLLDIIDPAGLLVGASGTPQAVKSRSSLYPWITASNGTSSVVTSDGPVPLLDIDSTVFVPDDGEDTDGTPINTIVFPEHSWSIYGVIRNFVGGSIQYIIAPHITVATAGPERLSIGFTTSDRLSVFDHQPGTQSEVNSSSTNWGPGAISFGVFFSSTQGVEIWRNGSLDVRNETAAAKVPMDSDPANRIAQLFGYGTGGSNALNAEISAMPIFSNYHGQMAGTDPMRVTRETVFAQLHEAYGVSV